MASPWQRSKRRGERSAAAVDRLQTRAAATRESTVNEEARTVEAVISSDAPVPMYDWQRGATIPEVLLPSGMRIARGDSVPLLDAHDRYSVDRVLGSVRGIKANGSEVTGTLHFAESASGAWGLVRGKHVTDVSVGYEALKRTYIDKGTTATVAGREFTGPVNVVTQWRLREVSLTPIGADENAKLRGHSAHGTQETEKMDPLLRKLLERAGMPANLNDEQAREWADANTVNLTAAAQPPAAQPPADRESVLAAAREAAVTAAREATAAERQQAEARSAEIDSLLRIGFGDHVPQEVQSSARALGSDTEWRKKVTDLIVTERARLSEADGIGGMSRIEYGDSQPRDAFRKDAGAALVLRAMIGGGVSQASIERAVPAAARNQNVSQMASIRLLDFARTCLEVDGFSPREVRFLSNQSLALAALGWPEKAGLRGRAAYHVTGSFPYLLADAVNKTLNAGYAETPATWRACFRQGESVQDFKTIYRVGLGAVPNLPVWQENRDPEQVSFGEKRESYAVEARSAALSFTWKNMVNDDLSGLTRGVQQLGAAAARTVNAVAWSQITANALMGDGVALFSAASGNRKRDNYITGSATPTVSTIGSMTKLMRLMRGVNTPEQAESQDVLNLQPRYLVGPAALETTILQLVNSIADPAASGNAGIFNPARTLTPIVEPLLDVDSATAFYLFAGTDQIDTVEVTFLAGQESPFVNDYVNEKDMSRNYLVIQTFNAKALDHRGMIKHKGAS